MTPDKPEIPDWTPAKRKHDPVEEVMHLLPYGVYVVGSTADGVANGMIADWVMQVSFEPRLLAVSFEHSSRSLARIRDHRVFTVNLLPEGQDGLELARSFVQPADGAKIQGRSAAASAAQRNKLDGVDHRLTDSGCPILEDAVAWLACEAQDFVNAGDHTLVIARVLDGETQSSDDVLTSTYTGWSYSG